MGWHRRVTLATSLLTGVVLVLAVVLVIRAPVAGVLIDLGLGLGAVPVSASAVLGVVIAYRRPYNIVGLLLVLVGLTEAVTAARDIGWWYLAQRRPQVLPSLDWLAAVTDQSAVWVFVTIALLLLYFPDGRLPGPRWWWIPPTLIICAVIEHVGASFGAEPFRAPLQHIPRPWAPLPAPLQLPINAHVAGVGPLPRRCARSRCPRCVPGCSAGWTAGSTRFGALPWPRSRP